MADPYLPDPMPEDTQKAAEARQMAVARRRQDLLTLFGDEGLHTAGGRVLAWLRDVVRYDAAGIPRDLNKRSDLGLLAYNEGCRAPVALIVTELQKARAGLRRPEQLPLTEQITED